MAENEQLVGSWELVSIEQGGRRRSVEDTVRVDVYPDGRYSITLEHPKGKSIFTGSYEVEGSRIRRTADSGLELPIFSFEIREQTLVLHFPTGESFTLRAVRDE